MYEFHIIDDEDYMRELLRAIISGYGHLTQDFSSASSYLAFMNSTEYKPPTAILTDYMMPNMNGYELIQHVHQKLPKQKIVLISGSPAHQINALSGLCHTLQKPFKMDELDAIITVLIHCHENPEDRESCPLNKSCSFKQQDNI